MSLLELHGVNKAFGAHAVLSGLDLAVDEGTIYGFVGENGAGKTTTMKLILGLEKADAGRITYANQTITFASTHGIGYLPDVPAYYDDLSASEYLTLCGRLTKTPDLAARVAAMLKLVALPATKQRIHGFSRGMRQRLGIASALLNRPRLLLCDEPTSALDPAGRREFLDLLASLRHETTIVMSTHILSDVERICDVVGILHHGKLQRQAPLSELLGTHQTTWQLSFQTAAQAHAAAKLLGGSAADVNVSLPQTTDRETLLRQCLDAHLVPLAFSPKHPTLEDVFMEVIA